MKFQYTDAALQELQAFQSHQQKLLEELISERKFVFGDETVEVTASDIKEASSYIRAYRPRIARYSSLRSLSQIYVALGALISLGGYIYPSFQSLFVENRVQGMAILTGFVMMAFGGLAGYLYRARIHRYDEIERMKDMERIRYFRNDKDSA
jgi:hypothetical protein